MSILKLLSISILSLVVFLCNRAENGPYLFVGYRNDIAVFYDAGNSKLILENEGKFEEILEVPRFRKVVFVNNDLIVYREVKKDSVFIVLSKHGTENEYPVNSDLTYISGNETRVFYTDLETETNEIIEISDKRLNRTSLQGYVVGADSNSLYFSKEHDPDLVNANADIYSIDIDQIASFPKKIANNLSGENTYIFPDGQLIYDNILYEGSYHPIILNVSSGKYAFLEMNISTVDHPCYYSYKGKSLIFYDPISFSKDTVEVPNVFILEASH